MGNWPAARRYAKEVVDRGKVVWKCVSASNLYHFAMGAVETIGASADRVARLAAHRAKKTDALLAHTQKLISERTKAKAVGDLFFLSQSHSTTREPAVSVYRSQTYTSSLVKSALIMRSSP